ncbi:methyltransferase domain-containing protein [Noviherbaspirillum massiliense]|uniref:spermine/spermidine synthase domain-containing protein n=1 Tax=Noviherbaspirillum massiliense TaxID=1465823 RepID=UPI0002FE45B9|nr:methyltransferase domain-containing protein [Noviherbaspirillum massiliense]
MKNSQRDDAITLPPHFADALNNSGGKPFAFDHGDMRTLHFDEKYIQSAMRISAPDDLLLSYTQAMMGFLLFNPAPQHILMIGLGGGSLAKYCYRGLPATRITVIELDTDVIALRSTFCVPDNNDRFQVVQADAIDYLSAMNDQVDVILHDGFTADGLAPTLSSEAFYRRCHDVLEQNGVLVSNLWGDTADLLPMMKRLYGVFHGNLWWCDASSSFNRIVFSGRNVDAARFHLSLRKRAAQLDLHHGFSFRDLADRLKTACGKNRAEFEAIAGAQTFAQAMQAECSDA